MAKRDRIISTLNKYLNTSQFKDYSPIGLQVEGAADVNKIAIGVSLNMSLLELAVEAKAQMVMVHHGMFWENQSRVLKGAHKERIAFLLEHDLSLVAYHLPLDAHRVVGNNAQIIKLLGAHMKEGFGDYKGIKLGFVGAFQKGQPPTKILKRLETLSEDPVYFASRSKTIKRIAVVSGGAGDIFPQAIESGVDMYITGELSEPALALTEETGIGFLALGHYNSEKPGILALGAWTKTRFKVDVEFIDIPNPA